MSVVEVPTPGRTVSRGTWFVRGLGLGIVGCGWLWLASEQTERAQEEAGSNFAFPLDEIALAQLLFLLAGATFSVALLIAGIEMGKRSWILVGAALPPLALLLVFWDFVGPSLIPVGLRRSVPWAMGGQVQTACLVALGALATALVWPSVTRARRGP